MTMQKSLEKILLILVAVALAFAPLRGALAVSVAAEPAAHCDQMQDGARVMDHDTGTHDDAGAHQAGHGCDRGCDGSCCDGDCGTCAHASIALPNSLAGTPNLYNDSLTVVVSHRFTGRNPHPPFRPPIALS